MGAIFKFIGTILLVIFCYFYISYLKDTIKNYKRNLVKNLTKKEIRELSKIKTISKFDIILFVIETIIIFMIFYFFTPKEEVNIEGLYNWEIPLIHIKNFFINYLMNLVNAILISTWTLYFECFKTLKIKAKEELNIIKELKIKVYCSSTKAQLELFTLILILLNIYSNIIFKSMELYF
jgi:hypothetical protein